MISPSWVAHAGTTRSCLFAINSRGQTHTSVFEQPLEATLQYCSIKKTKAIHTQCHLQFCFPVQFYWAFIEALKDAQLFYNLTREQTHCYTQVVNNSRSLQPQVSLLEDTFSYIVCFLVLFSFLNSHE